MHSLFFYVVAINAFFFYQLLYFIVKNSAAKFLHCPFTFFNLSSNRCVTSRFSSYGGTSSNFRARSKL